MKKINDAKKYLVYVNKDLIEYLGGINSQNILPDLNRVNNYEIIKLLTVTDASGKVDYTLNSCDFILKCSYSRKKDAEYAVNEIIFRTSKVLANDINFHISANNIAKILINKIGA